MIIIIALMKDSNDLDENQKVLIEAFKLQNQQAYDESLEKLQLAGQNLIRTIEKIQSSSQFYMRHMQLMKEQRDLVCEKDYKQFLVKNDKILSHNFQKNAYLALLMQEIEDRDNQIQSKKWSNKQQQLMKRIIKDGTMTLQQIELKFQRHKKEEIIKKYEQLKAMTNGQSDANIMDCE